MNDSNVIDGLVKENSVIIYVAGNMQYLVNLHEDLFVNNEYSSIKLIVDSIKKFNPQAYFMYASSTSVYGDKTINGNKEAKDIKIFILNIKLNVKN